MKILISGSHGLVGKALISELNKDKHEIVSLVRHASERASEIEWHPNQGSIDSEHVSGFDVVVHLAGELCDATKRFDPQALHVYLFVWRIEGAAFHPAVSEAGVFD